MLDKIKAGLGEPIKKQEDIFFNRDEVGNYLSKLNEPSFKPVTTGWTRFRRDRSKDSQDNQANTDTTNNPTE